ncbi:uncharacterized protein ACBR49_011156 [Aulostomus maculatus]
MGNLPTNTGLFTTETSRSERGRFLSRKIRRGMTYYYGVSDADQQSPFKDPPAAPHPSTPPHSPSSPLLQHTPASSQSDTRPVLLFLSWLGAHPSVVSKYTDMYLERGVDVLLVQSNVMHFLWPRWGLEYGSEVLQVLEEPQFSCRPLLVYASSIGGYTFTQILTHISQEQEQHAGLAQRVRGHIYDSLVAGTLEHMAIGLAKTLLPHLEALVKNLAMFYFWLFKSSTADYYNHSIHVFNNSPITAPALFFFCENDALCDPAAIENTIECWRERGVAVQSRKWKESIHAAHMRCHPEDYRSTLERFLNTLPFTALQTRI